MRPRREMKRRKKKESQYYTLEVEDLVSLVIKLSPTLLIRWVRAWPETPLVAFEAKLWESSVPAELCLLHSSAHRWPIRRQKSRRKELANAGILLRPWLISLGHLVHHGFIFLTIFLGVNKMIWSKRWSWSSRFDWGGILGVKTNK